MGKFTNDDKPKLKEVLLKAYKMSGNKEKIKPGPKTSITSDKAYYTKYYNENYKMCV